MFTRKKSYVLFSCLIVSLALIISACGSDNEESSSSGDSSNNNSEITMDSKKGEVTIPKDAERIIAPYHEDALLALGVKPAAKWAIGNSIQNYLEGQLKDVPKIEWNLPLEQVMKYNPDLIILSNTLDSYEGSYEDYQKIAPTYVLSDEAANNWRKQIELFGKMLGKEDKAQKVLKQYDDKVSNAKEKLNKSIGDETVAMIWTMGNKFYLFEKDRHVADIVYSELGIKAPEVVKSLGKAPNDAWNAISIEKLSQLKADHVFLLGMKGEEGIKTLKNSSVWQSTPAAKSGNVYVMNDPSHWTNEGLIASEKTIDAIVETLAK
ncbi:iron-hydroxamate ABC transporter substrate-binding protein [Virgibacillus siamensis]|uniref:iron-hydroxamate ABC transporter substrate-binding protein n=1 Tax=Virgibacillus siamensis TaxID=480071 RepID=UPI000985C69D|nr:iron-hydroxamate ABC transporter substrate-binding protein [Virgibacillus siamensis]